MPGLFVVTDKKQTKIVNSKSRSLFMRKMKRVVGYIKREYRFRSNAVICRHLGEPVNFLKNLMYNGRQRYLQGPPINRMHDFCNKFGLSLEYFANPNIPVNSNFIADKAPNIFVLQTHFCATGASMYLHMVAGLVLGALSKYCAARMVIHETHALITVYGGSKAGLTYVISHDDHQRFTIAHTYTDLQAAQGRSLLTDAFLTSLCDGLEKES